METIITTWTKHYISTELHFPYSWLPIQIFELQVLLSHLSFRDSMRSPNPVMELLGAKLGVESFHTPVCQRLINVRHWVQFQIGAILNGFETQNFVSGYAWQFIIKLQRFIKWKQTLGGMLKEETIAQYWLVNEQVRYTDFCSGVPEQITTPKTALISSQALL